MSNSVSAPVSTVPETQGVISDFWVASYPFFETTLFVLPPPNSHATDGAESHIEVFDADGELVNEVDFGFPNNRVGMLEVDPLLGSCKLESGLKQAHLRVSSTFSTRHFCRMYTQELGALLGQPLAVSDDKGVFFPVCFSEERSALLCLINNDREMARVRCRILSSKRSPELVISVPALGCRAMVVETLFPEMSQSEQGKRQIAYLRVVAKEGQARVAAQLVERLEAGDNRIVYSSVN